ncbi:hypothetical protein AB0I00_40590 [Streptomyces sp. NPDC050803]|uniref:hypothetical protein n=1 Tax=unclassified Streptomyces TaxID=2593676 RepID=UPI003413E499
MDLRGRKLKFTAVTALVVLALTGFSSGRGHGGSSGDSDSGGGCSSSSQNHDSSSGSRDDDDDYDAPGAGGAGVEEVTVELVSCATAQEPYAAVEVTNPNSTGDNVTVVVTFLDAQSGVVDMQTVDEYVDANATVAFKVNLTSETMVADVDHCEAQLMPSAG